MEPCSQRQGIGSALVRAGTDPADEDGMVCWLEASPAGHGLYQSFGWNDVGSMPVDLSEWGGQDRGLGVYMQRYMLRLPFPVKG